MFQFSWPAQFFRRWDIRSPWTLCDAATRFECLPCFPTSCECCVSCLYSSCILLFVSFLFCIYCTFCSERLDEMNLLIECSKLAENKRGRVRCLFTCPCNIWRTMISRICQIIMQFAFFLCIVFILLFGATHAKRFSLTTLIDRSMQGVFFKEGDTSNVMFLILRGTANVVNKDPFTEVLRPVCPCCGFHC